MKSVATQAEARSSQEASAAASADSAGADGVGPFSQSVFHFSYEASNASVVINSTDQLKVITTVFTLNLRVTPCNYMSYLVDSIPLSPSVAILVQE